MEKIKIFLVEDEIVIRNGIKSGIEWEAEGYEFVGEPSDGELAYPMILKEKPDILITDIRMPKINGLDLICMTRELKKDIKFVVISGYKEFEYAHRALQYGVDDYLLKPINEDELNKVLGKICGPYPP